MGGKDTPDPPDYEAAAERQAESSAEVTNMQTYANRPDQNTPYGSTRWSNASEIDPATGQRVTRWTQDTSLRPELEEALNSQVGLTRRRSDMAAGLYDRVEEEFAPIVDFNKFDAAGNPLDPNEIDRSQLQGFMGLDSTGLPNIDPRQLDNTLDYSGAHGVGDPRDIRGRAEDAAYQSATSRLDPQFEQRNEQLEAKLRNQGLRPGDEAYDTAMENFGRERTDAYQQANYGAIAAGRDEAAQLFGQDVTRRGIDTGEEDAMSAFRNQAQGQDFQQSMASRGTQFGERGAESELARATREQQFSEQLRGGEQQFQQEKQASAYNTQLRQQQIAEEMQRRGFTLNEINALLTGQQVDTPDMPGFQNATKSDATQYMRAAESGFQAEMDVFSAEQQQAQMMMDGATSMGGAFMSDIRLKKNIKEIGGHPTLPLSLYSWTWNDAAVTLGVSWMPTEGVIAQEVMRVFPEAVIQTDSGMMAVNYELLANYEEAVSGR